MGNGYVSQPEGAEGIAARIKSIEQRLDALSQTAPSKSTTITDESGVPQIHLGALESGGHGIEQIVSGSWVPLAALAGGATAASEASEILIDAPDELGTSSWEDHGGQVSFTTYTGRFILILVASTVNATYAAAQMSYELSGAQSRGPSSSRSASIFTKDTDANGSLVYADFVSGDPGQVTLEPRYRAAGTVFAFTGAVSFQNRTTIVLPF